MKNVATTYEKPHYFVGIYSRLSVEKENSESIEHQIDIVQQFILENNANPQKEMELFIYDTYIDRGISGTSFERRDFERLMKDVREQKVNCIIVKDLSRFGRNYLETGNYIEKILPFLGCRFIAVTDHFDSMSQRADETKFTMNIKNLINDMYAKDISQKVTAAKKASAQNGSFIGGIAPYGYEIVSTKGIRKLQIKEDCAKIVQDIFTLYAKGTSIKAMITFLYDNKVHSICDYRKYAHVYWENGETLRQWSESSISRMLQNTNYLGNPHEPIISIELFQMVQDRKKSIHKKTTISPKDTEHIYRNILYCGCCGKRMHSSCYQSKTEDKRDYAYYCQRAYFIDDRKCQKNYMREEQITTLVLKQLHRLGKEQSENVKNLTILNIKNYEKEEKTYHLQEKKLCQKIDYSKKQAGNVYKKYKEGKIDEEEYHRLKRIRKEREWEIKRKQERIIQEKKEIEDRIEDEHRFLQAILHGENHNPLRIQWIEAWIERIFVFPNGSIEITYKF